jgi:hypothetical protein
MTRFLLALTTILAIGAGVASAATTHQSKLPQQQGENYNWLEGGGG